MHTEQLPALTGHHPGSLIPPGRAYCTGCWDATADLDADAVLTVGPVADLPNLLRGLAARARHDRLTATTDADRRFAAGQQSGLDTARSAWEAFRAHLDATVFDVAQRGAQGQDGTL